MLSPVVVVLEGHWSGRGRAKGVLEDAVLCEASAGDNSIDVISQSSAGPRAGAVFLEGLAVLPLSRRPFFDNMVVALVGEFLDPTFHLVAGSIVRVLNVCKDWREVLGRLFRRPSLCFFPALGTLLDGSEVDAEAVTGVGSFSEGPETDFETWKRNRALNMAQSRVNKPSAEVPLEATTANVAEAFGVDEADLIEILGGNQRFLRRLLLVQRVRTFPDPKRVGMVSERNLRDASFDLFPTPNKVERTEAPLFPPLRPFAHPQGATTFPLSDLVPFPDVLDKFYRYLKRLEADLIKGSQMAKLGRAYTPRVKTPFIIGPERFALWAVGHTFNTEDPNACFHVSMEVPWESPLRYDAVAAALGGANYPDQAFLHGRKFGMSHLAHVAPGLPYAVVVCPPNKSARPLLNDLARMTRTAEASGWGESFLALPSIPYHANAYGAIVYLERNPVKVRESSDLSGPHDTLSLDGRSFAVNDHVPLTTHFPRMRLVRVDELRASGAAVRSAWLNISGHHPELREVLRPTMVMEDCMAYFNQFYVALQDRPLQGKYYVDEDGVCHFFTQYTQQFGSRDAPVHCQANTNAMDMLARQRFEVWDSDICCQAEAWEAQPLGPAPLACKLAPLAYRSWRQLRIDRLAHDGGGPVLFNAGYIDDEMAFLLGTLRAIVFLVVYWEVLELFGLPPAEGKATVGDGFPLLGVSFFLSEGVVLVTEKKLKLYSEWSLRLEDPRKTTVERLELQAYTGTINFSRFGLLHPRLHLGPLYRASAGSYRLKRSDAVPLTASLRRHVKSIREEFELSGGVGALDMHRDDHDLKATMFSDSCRDKEHLELWSGMGGFCTTTCIWWFYRFSHEETLSLPIHVTEMWAANINLAVNALELRGTIFGDAVDNEAAVHVIQGHGARDPRLHDLVLMRHWISLQHDLSPVTSWIASEDNDLADPISHGRFEVFLQRAAALGYSRLRCLDIRRIGLFPEMESISSHLLAQTRRMSESSGRVSDLDL